MVRVVARDADGVLLGSGLSLTVDEDLLLPGGLAGPIEDLGDGSYLFPVASMQAGAAMVSVSVEGSLLQDAPTVIYETP